MRTKQVSEKRVSVGLAAALLALILLIGICAILYQQSALTDLNDSSQLLALIEKTTGHADAQVTATKSEGNLAVVSYSAQDCQGILLFERTSGQDDGRCRLLDWEEGGAGLHTYQTSLGGVVDVTVLYGENTEDAKTVTLLNTDDAASYTLEKGSVLELSMTPGASSDSQIELLHCGG